MDLRKIGEFGLIRKIRAWAHTSDPSLIQGIGDDVAVMKMGEKALLATTDILIEGVHFNRSWTDPYRLGKKSLAVNLSDIAAMGGVPRYFLITLGLPSSLSLSFVSRLYRGLKEEAKRFDVDLVGGDTSLAERLTINICLLGEGRRRNLVFRKGARIGDDLFVSGTLGDSSLGLILLREKGSRRRSRSLIEKHLSPCPQLSLGQALANQRLATAMIDVSDGLLADTNHILEESKVGALLWEARVPLSRSYKENIGRYSKDPLSLALRGGEDYELLFTSSPRVRTSVSSLATSLRIPVTRIGTILPQREGLRVARTDGKEYSPSRLGFDHFR